MNYWLFIIIPLVSALIGWIINSVVIKVLFHPRTPKRILGITFQGIFPKRQQQFAEKIGKLVSNEFFSFDDIEQKISSPESFKKIMPMIEDHIDDFLRHKLGVEMPMIAMFIGDKTISKLKEAFMKEIETLFPLVMKQYASNMKNDLDFEKIVTSKLGAFPSDKLEMILQQAMTKEFRSFKILGAVTGFIIGLIQVLIMILTA